MSTWSEGTRTSAQPDWCTWTSGPPMSSEVIFWLLAPLMSAAPAMTMYACSVMYTRSLMMGM